MITSKVEQIASSEMERRRGSDRETARGSKEPQWFQCALCDFSCPYDYYGDQPAYEHNNISYEENVFSLRDPFSTERPAGALVVEEKFPQENFRV